MDVDDIGKGDAALHCRTDKNGCCGDPKNSREGEWYFPSGMKVGTEAGTEDEFYRNRAAKIVRLNHRQHIFTERGLFQCKVPDVSNTLQTVYVNICKFLLIFI